MERSDKDLCILACSSGSIWETLSVCMVDKTMSMDKGTQGKKYRMSEVGLDQEKLAVVL